MEQTISILLSAVVLIATAFTVLVFSQGGIGNVFGDANQVKQNQVCQTQARQVEQGELSPSEVDPKCAGYLDTGRDAALGSLLPTD